MLDVVYDFDTQQSGNHIIGKGLAWEIMFSNLHFLGKVTSACILLRESSALPITPLFYTSS